MNKKSYLITASMILIFLISMVLVYLFMRTAQFASVDIWIKQNIVLYVLALFIYKAIGVLWPPFPAGLLTLVSIPFLGWFGAYLVDLVGSIVGGSIAYFLGKRYGHNLLKKLFDGEILRKITNAKIKKGKEIEAVFMYRVLLGSTILEAVYYGAGFLKINYKKFLIGAILSHMAVGIPTFFLAKNIFSGNNLLITGILIAISTYLVYKTKGRYFE